MSFFKIDGQKFSSREWSNWLRHNKHDKLIALLNGKNLSKIVGSYGTTLLHFSAQCKSIEMTKYLLSVNFDINVVNNLGETPLMLALRRMKDTHTVVKFYIAKILLNAGADLWKMKNHDGHSALKIVLDSCHLGGYSFIMDEIEKRCSSLVEVVNVLIDAGCQLYHLNFFKKLSITKLMLERGCKIFLQNPKNEFNTALHVAAEINDLDTVKVLLQFGADKEAENNCHATPFFQVFENDNPNTELIKLLMPDGNDWIEDSFRWENIFKKCSSEVLQIVLQRFGSIVSARNSDAFIPLYSLLLNKDSRVWKVLKSVKLNLNFNQHDVVMFHQAVRLANPDALQFLLNKGVNVNLPNNSGQPALVRVLFYKNDPRVDRYLKCVELLMENGANAQLVYDNGKSIICYLKDRLDLHELLDPIIAHLAISEARGSTLNTVIFSHINSSAISKNIFTKYKDELERAKSKNIGGGMTLFKFLTEKERKIWKYLRNDEVFKELSQIKSVDYLHRLLMKRFKRATDFCERRKKASQFITECIEVFMGNYVVLEKILDFLSFEDLEFLATCSE